MERNILRAIKGEPNNTNNMKAIEEMKPRPKAKASNKNNNTREEGEEEKEEEESGFQWPPPRAYKCGFCKRQFRSAQALGGHMNVHRRDRAKLRRSPPMDSSFSSSSEPIKYLKLSQLSCFSNGEEEEADGGGGCEIWKKVQKLVRMEKEISLVGSSNEIDLELRLGF